MPSLPSTVKLRPDVAAEVRRVVGVGGHDQPASQQLRERVLSDVLDDLQPEVRERAHRERGPVAAKPLHELRIVDRGVAVIDPLPPELERFPHICGRPLLAGVADLVLAELPGALVDGSELRRRVAALGGIEADADPPVRERQRVLERLAVADSQLEMAQQADDQVRADPQPLRVPPSSPSVIPSITVSIATPALGVRLRVAEDLDVPDVVLGGPLEVGDRQPAEVIASPQHLARGVVDVEEVLQLTEVVGGLDRLDVRVGSSTPFRAASSNISSGSSVPSMWMCSSAFGSSWARSATAAHSNSGACPDASLGNPYVHGNARRPCRKQRRPSQLTVPTLVV